MHSNKIYFHELSRHLSKSKYSLYTIAGDEPFLQKEALTQLIAHAKQLGFHAFNRFYLHTEENLNSFALYLQNLSLFAENEFLELHFSETHLAKGLQEKLAQLLEAKAPSYFITIVTNKLNEKTKQAPWLKVIEKNGILISIWPLAGKPLLDWIKTKAAVLKLRLTQEAVVRIAEGCFGNSANAAETLEKLYLLNTKKIIDAEEIGLLMSDESRFTLFELLDPLLEKNRETALRILHDLKREETDPILLLWLLCRELRLLMEGILLINEKKSLTSFFQKNRIFQKREALYQKAFNHYTLEHLQSCLLHAFQTECILKGAGSGNVWESMEKLCLHWLCLK